MAEQAERVVDRWSIPDDIWDVIALLIPPRVNTHPFGGGKPPKPDRVYGSHLLRALYRLPVESLGKMVTVYTSSLTRWS
jgi:hypothetical protein